LNLFVTSEARTIGQAEFRVDDLAQPTITTKQRGLGAIKEAPLYGNFVQFDPSFLKTRMKSFSIEISQCNHQLHRQK
ncbi:Hypothetical predicted protein, partial [Olea europaea subsp. europaea]